jgi:hypothetical protein
MVRAFNGMYAKKRHTHSRSLIAGDHCRKSTGPAVLTFLGAGAMLALAMTAKQQNTATSTMCLAMARWTVQASAATGVQPTGCLVKYAPDKHTPA